MEHVIDWLRREMLEPEITLGDRRVPIVLRRNARARRLTLRLAPDGAEVRITLPRWARSAEAIAFAHARREWLEQQVAKVPPPAPPVTGGTLVLRGEEYTIAWRADSPRLPQIDGDQILVGGPETSLPTRLRRWVEGLAHDQLASDVAHYCDRAGIAAVPVALSRAQRRWGSCSQLHTIRINWRLIQAPEMVRRSVAAHEVAHLVHFDHSPQFHALLADLFEGDISDADRWLRAHGRTLYTAFG